MSDLDILVDDLFQPIGLGVKKVDVTRDELDELAAESYALGLVAGVEDRHRQKLSEVAGQVAAALLTAGWHTSKQGKEKTDHAELVGSAMKIAKCIVLECDK